MIRCMLIAALAVLVTGCASQKAPELKQAPFPEEKAFAPPTLSQPDSPPASVSSTPPADPAPPPSAAAGAPQPAPAPSTPQPDTPAAAASPTGAAPAASEAGPGLFAAAEPTDEPAAELAPDKSAAGTEQLGEISSSTPGATVPSRPCNLDNCGVIVAINHHKGAEEVPPGAALDPAEGPGVYVGGEVAQGDMAGHPTSEQYEVFKMTKLWEIRVRMHTGKIRVIQQDYAPFLEVGDPVLVDGNNLLMWH